MDGGVKTDSIASLRKAWENESRIMVVEAEMKGILKTLDAIQNNHLAHIQEDIAAIKEKIASLTPQNKLVTKAVEFSILALIGAGIALIVKG